MTRSLIQRVRLTARKLVKFGMIAITAAILTQPVTAQAQQQPTIKFKENNRLDANGDGHFNYEIKLPVAVYTQFKVNTPNTAVLLRKIGLNNQNMLVEDVVGTWDDGNSTLKIDYSVKGIARAGKDSAWEVPLFEGLDTDLVAVTGDTAVLTQAMNIRSLGLATSTIRVRLPEGATDVKLLKDPSRLSYKPPVASHTSGSAKADFSVEAKPQLMSALAKAYSNTKFPALNVARSQFKNTGGQTLNDYRVRFRIAEYAPTWSSWEGTPVVVPGQTVCDSYFPVFDNEKIGKLTGSTKVAMEVQYQYTTASGQKVEDSETKTMMLLSRNEVFYSGMKSEDCADFADRFQLSEAILASFTTHEDPVIQQAAGRIAKAIGGANAAGSDAEAEKFMKAAFDFMGKNVAYQTPPTGQGNNQLMQHVKYGRDVLKNKAGTCIDLAILYGSLCEAVGLEPVLYIIPGHCFPAVRMPQSGKIIPVEATMIGNSTFLAANKHALEQNLNPMLQGKKPYILADIVKLHNAGIKPLDLPTMADDVLNQWGIEWNFAQAQVKPQTDEAKPDAASLKVKATLVGYWANTVTVNGTQYTERWWFGDNGRCQVTSNTNGQLTTYNGMWVNEGTTLRFELDNGKKSQAAVVISSDSEIRVTFTTGQWSVLYRQPQQ